MRLWSLNKSIDVARVAAIVFSIGLLYSPSAASISLIVCYVAFLAAGREAWARLGEVFSRPIGYWGLGFLAVVVVGMAYSTVPWQDRLAEVLKWRTLLWFFVVAAIFDEDKWRDRLLFTFVGGTAVGLIASFITASGLVKLWAPPEHLLRVSVTQAMAFACSTLFCVWMIVTGRIAGRWVWIGWLLVALYIANVVFITNGRSGYALLGLGLFVLLSWDASWRMRTALFVGLALCSVLAVAVSPKVQGKLNDALQEWKHESELQDLTSFGIRRVYYTNSLEIIRNHWLFGVGTGGFAKAYAEQIDGKYAVSDWRAIKTTDPHNQYMTIWIQHGIVGVLIFSCWLIVIGVHKSGRAPCRGLAVALLMGWCVTSLFSSHFRTFVEGHLLATFLGALLAVPKTNEIDKIDGTPRSHISHV